MNNNTNQAITSRKGRDNVADFKPKRRNAKKDNIGLGIQPISLEGCEYALSSTKVELIKLDVKHLDTGVMERFNFINGSDALDAIMDVLDETGELDIDFKDYIGETMNVEIVEVDRFRNIINAWAITTHANRLPTLRKESDNEQKEDYYYGDEDLEDDDIDLSELLDDSEEA